MKGDTSMSTKRSDKQKQVKNLELMLLITGITGALTIAGFVFINFHSTILASADGTQRDSLYGLNIIVFSSAIATAYSFINFKNLLKVDREGLSTKFTKNDFIAKVEIFNSSSQGILLVNIFTLVYWSLYCSSLKIKYYVADNDKLVDFTTFNYIWLGVMLLAVIFSVVAVRAAKTVKRKWN